VGDLGDPFSRSTFALNPGETVFQCLDRAAKQRGVMLLTEPDGNMTLDRAGSMKVQTVLEYGKNIKAGNKRVSWQDRFSAYTIKAQTKGDDNLFGSSTSLKRTSNDAGVTRYRPIIIAAENEDSGTELQKRADWERNVRAGRSARLTYTVEGWRHSTGLWEPNFLVRVKDPVLEIDQELLIVETTQTRSDQGTITTLVLTAKEAFDVQPLPPKTKKGLLD
jgi:prophage tail gpP-like protein